MISAADPPANNAGEGNGAGEATLYEVIDQPATGTLVLKYESGEIVTWSKVDTGIRIKLPGEMEQWVYFSKVKS